MKIHIPWITIPVVVAVMLLLFATAYSDDCPNPTIDIIEDDISNECVAPPGQPCAYHLTRTMMAYWNRAPYAPSQYTMTVSGSVAQYQTVQGNCDKVDHWDECGYYIYAPTTGPGNFIAEGYDSVAGPGSPVPCYAEGFVVWYSPYISCSRGTNRTVRDSRQCPRIDDDGDGYTVEEGDCNDNPDDNGAAFYPGAPIGNCFDCSSGEDRNCDGIDDCSQCESPIVIDVRGDGYALTSRAGGVQFDLRANGFPIQTPWTTRNGDDAWLVLDRNNNGQIDNGLEMFGNRTEQVPSPRPNGFLALSVYDTPVHGGNSDGVINSEDQVFQRLRLWQDINHNGISESDELCPLPRMNVAVIHLDYKESRKQDEYGNWFRYRAKIDDANKTKVGRWAWDVFLTAR